MKHQANIPELAVKPARKASQIPRLIKAAEQAAAAAEREAERAAVAKPAPRPVVRTPRGAADARAIFNSLFADPAKA